MNKDQSPLAVIMNSGADWWAGEVSPQAYSCHCEERSDEAIQRMDRHALLRRARDDSLA
jgi:hypothetical protein